MMDLANSLDAPLALGTAIIATAIIGLLHNLSAAIWAAVYLGPMGALGNRELMPQEEGWGRRARRGLHNFLENAILFVLLLVAGWQFQISEKTSAYQLFALGALIFAVFRGLYLPVFLIGVPVVRTLVWMVSIFGLGVMTYAVAMGMFQ